VYLPGKAEPTEGGAPIELAADGSYEVESGRYELGVTMP
jgi:hypothetical protein